ncbi:DEAD/DEAH box helicase [Lacrimispora amygdalina]|uniref:DEAD/DEAH box helicase n=1 Tax=Lacrimispora amygdalina TaxID=253257 RepID=UPI000BE3D315|nr:DEAD/DEAH box helicase [Lacrimispora amygdalina]
MNRQDIAVKIEMLINGEISIDEIIIEISKDPIDAFYWKTVRRLLVSYGKFVSDTKYKDDYIMALRDYLIIFDESVHVSDDQFLLDNEFGISLDAVENKYFASFCVLEGINEKFVKEAFIKEGKTEIIKYDANLIADSKIVELTGYTRFKTLDQKIAVYGALNTPEGYTSLISLPTGGGKSLVTQTISYQKDGLTIVVVPTVSLALDQERVTREIIKRTSNEREIFAYSSGVNAGPILKAIQDKKAKVLFISPEALLENPHFFNVIRDANKARYLKNIVIDEAHIVVDWGAGFRVDYQCLEAWRNMLLMSNPSLRTILLSATFEDKCVEILKNFFEVDGKWIEIRCDALRHEPRYCVVRKRSNDEKEASVVDMVKKLPHPLIIYVARPVEAEHYKELLSKSGINNVKTFTGLTGASQRRQLIQEWVDDEFEVMIATSAFGIGVDKPDVRTVIHTYIPQNANTFYQELGRGGRDGLPCLSVMCLHPEDATIGRDRITKKVLTAEKILGRWDSMYNNPKSKRFPNNKVCIDTSIRPNYADNDEFDDSPTSDADMNWNVYVLLILRRYNMIKILEVSIETGKYMIIIEIVDDRLRTNNAALKDHIENIREAEWNYYNDAYNAMSNSVRSNSQNCLSELFTDTYSKVYEFCAGCNAHSSPIIGDVPKFPLKNRVGLPLRKLTEEQAILFGDSPEAVIICKNTEKWNVLDRLIEKGASLIIFPDEFDADDITIDIKTKKNVFIVGLEEAYQLSSKKSLFYTSGLIAVVYPENEREIGEQYNIIRNNFCEKESTRVIHIINKNAYIASAEKTFTEMVNGPSLQANVVYV